MTRAHIGVGANISPEANIRVALRQLAAEVRLVAVSTFYRTAAEGRPEQPSYVNGVVAIETDLPPQELKEQVLRAIERRLGRRWSDDMDAPRPIDLDLLLYGSLHVQTPELRLPSSDIEERAFVAVPLAEVASDLIVPGTGLSARDIAARFAGVGMKPLTQLTSDLRRQLLESGGDNERR